MNRSTRRHDGPTSASAPAPVEASAAPARSTERGWGTAGRVKVFLNVASMSLLAFIVLLGTNWLASRHWVRFDMTFDRTYTLSEKTKAVLDELARTGRRVRIIGMWLPQNPAHGVVIPKVKDLLEGYRSYSKQVEVVEYDAATQGRQAIQELTSLKMEQADPNDIILVCGDVKKVLHLNDLYEPELGAGWQRQETRIRSFTAEQGITSAIASVTAAKKVTMYWVTGHAELDAFNIDQNGGAKLKEMLEKQENYDVKVLELPRAKAVPDDADVLAIVGPMRKFLPEEIDVLRRYLAKAGHILLLLWQTVTSERLGLEDLLREYGVAVRDDMIFDPSRKVQITVAGPGGTATVLPVNPTLANAYGAHEIVAKLSANDPTFFFCCRSLEVLEDRARDLAVTPLVLSTRDSWGETEWREKDEVLTPGKDAEGPLNYAVAISRRVGAAPEGGGRIPEARIVAIGDRSLATNFYLDNMDRKDLLLNSIRWLAEQEYLITIVGRKPEDRKVTNVDEARMGQITFTLVGLIPFLMLVLGGCIWWLRRK